MAATVDLTNAMNSSPSTKIRVLEAVLRVIASNGVDAVTHRRVADEANVSAGVVSYHFPTRDGLIEESFRYYLDDAESLADSVGVQASAIKPDALAALVVKVVAKDLGDRPTMAIELELVLYASRNNSLRALYLDWELGLQGYLASILERGGCTQPVRGARIVMGMARAFETEALIDEGLGPQELRARLNMVLPTLLPGLPT